MKIQKLVLRTKPGALPGWKLYEKKRYCANCGVYRKLDELARHEKGYLFCVVCNYKVRNGPRQLKLKSKYQNGAKRI
ncbi:MAG TPA: hypothetical protein VL854_07145 [Nitrososphaeraceae archaeon]|nr:hypothetical protein [Nitrososphaeraceae archaeon]